MLLLQNQDAIVFCGVAASAFTALIGRRVLSVGRRGKHFYLQFDQPPALVCHFGMTGNIQVRGIRLTGKYIRKYVG
jgi:formamidopyrimidine-DNA glycosylase